MRGHEDEVNSAAFSADGTRIVTASKDKTARIWDVASGKELAVLRGHQGEVNSAAFSANGTRIVTASEDKTAGVWDAATSKELAVLRGHEETVLSAAFSADGTRIVTASKDKTARVWDSVPYRERFPQIARARAAAARMVPMIRGMLATGQTPDAVAQKIASDPSLAPEERIAAQAELNAFREHE